ncbi:MAG: [protein-PII] uridylyltransferase [Planctomycetaceae bacterium]
MRSILDRQHLPENLALIRERARRLFDGGATGIQVAAAISEETDEFLVGLVNLALNQLNENSRQLLLEHAAVIAVGGSGRGDPAPHSDVDLLFLYEDVVKEPFSDLSAQVVRDCWDAKIKLGHAVRNLHETVALARTDVEVATALVETRRLWGNPELVQRLNREVARRAIQGRARAFTADCINAREKERAEKGPSATQLEPDVKGSLGGLRDIHLIRWLGFAHYQVADIGSLRMKGALSRDDARRLLAAQEYLMRLRIDMHFAAGRPQDVLTREEQLRIAQERGITSPDGQRPVEHFMKTYFKHSTAVAEITQRFVENHQSESLVERVIRMLMTRRINGNLKIGPKYLDMNPRHHESACQSLERILGLYRTAILYGVMPSPSLSEFITKKQAELSGTFSEKAAGTFLDIFRRSANLGRILRRMYSTGILELVIPNMAHARCLMQFNQYHAHTVDEHTLRAVEAVASFENADGPLGAAYRRIEHKELLHLAVLLHDLGKGFPEDHSEVGKVIAETVGLRLFLPDHHRETLTFLVHKHLRMSHLALRRNFSDPELLMEFSREVGSPERLRMLYVLTAADLMSVGPKTWTDWKAELLTELYDRAMLILSGKHQRFNEEERLAAIKRDVSRCLQSQRTDSSEEVIRQTIDEQLAEFPPHYLETTTAEQIADDLRSMHHLQPGELQIDDQYDESTNTLEFRVIVSSELAEGCFHKITGALNAKQCEILSAQICTSLDGTVVDRFQIIDKELEIQVTQERIDNIADAIRTAVKKKTPVKKLFQRFMRFDDATNSEPISDLQTRVVIDNDSSKAYTIIDIFAHDRRGLLYTVTRAIYKLELSVVLAKISTHLDQVVDVFYVTDFNGEKIRDGERLKEIRSQLSAVIKDFQRQGHVDYVS